MRRLEDRLEHLAGIVANSPFDPLERGPGQDEDPREERDLQADGPPSDARRLRAVAARTTHLSPGACLRCSHQAGNLANRLATWESAEALRAVRVQSMAP